MQARRGQGWLLALLLLLLPLPAAAAAAAASDSTSSARADVDDDNGEIGPARALSSDSGCTCNLDLARVVRNNLGGHGPDKDGGPMLRYGHVCTVEGRPVDLVIEVVSGDYEVGEPDSNGRSGCGPYGSINVKYGTMVSLKARFLDAEKDRAVKVGGVLFSVLDVDLHGEHREKVTLRGYDALYLSPASSLEHEPIFQGGVFTSSRRGKSAECVKDPLSMSKEQSDVAVTVLFREVSEFAFSFEVLGERSSKESRDFRFGGPSSIQAKCKAPPTPAPTPAPLPEEGEEEEDEEDDSKGAGCDAECEMGGRRSTCRERVQWSADYDFPRHPAACILAASVVRYNCPACASCPLSSARCTTPAPFDCETGLLKAATSWSPERRVWCCEHHGAACGAVEQVAVSPQLPPFLCLVRLGAWEAGWSDEKKDYCCRHEHLGCPTGSEDSVAVSAKFERLQEKGSSTLPLEAVVVVSVVGSVVGLMCGLVVARKFSGKGAGRLSPTSSPSASTLVRTANGGFSPLPPLPADDDVTPPSALPPPRPAASATSAAAPASMTRRGGGGGGGGQRPRAWL